MNKKQTMGQTDQTNYGKNVKFYRKKCTKHAAYKTCICSVCSVFAFSEIKRYFCTYSMCARSSKTEIKTTTTESKCERKKRERKTEKKEKIFISKSPDLDTGTDHQVLACCSLVL